MGGFVMVVNLAEVIKQKDAAESGLFKLDGVHGVDVGFKYSAGKRTDEISIRVLVSKKKKTVSAKQQIPTEINGIRTDVIESVITPFTVSQKLDDVSLLVDTTKYSTLEGGVSIGPERSINNYIFVGTLGCIVRDNVTNNPMLLSNFHVMCVDDGWHIGDEMCQPGRVDGGVPNTDRVGTLARAVLSNHVDGAICTLSGRPYDCSIIDIGDVKGTANAVLNSPVSKRGRTTLLTKGFVDAINATLSIDYGDGLGVVTLTNQIGIRPDNSVNPKFSDHGDSGSVVMDANNKVIGLLFGGNSSGYTYINPISYVLNELNITICKKPVIKAVHKEIIDKRPRDIIEKRPRDVKRIEKFEKIELKEQKLENKEYKEVAKEKNEIKERYEKYPREGKPITDKLDKPDDGRIPDINNPGLQPPIRRSLEERLAAIEHSIGTLTSFIDESLRPDLGTGALNCEEDIAAEQDKMEKDIADNIS
jgi:hypothetical protein